MGTAGFLWQRYARSVKVIWSDRETRVVYRCEPQVSIPELLEGTSSTENGTSGTGINKEPYWLSNVLGLEVSPPIGDGYLREKAGGDWNLWFCSSKRNFTNSGWLIVIHKTPQVAKDNHRIIIGI